ncbi:RNA-directed DNA polymerase [Pseudomonas veronii]|uniref:reverse transcriptase family protein n=1 Tax=Pseudomonas veronii TaxID=76761 RepID=UPI0018E898FA|nr:reverse transcriptase family protein [Pseudomonas veronii]MBJ2178932.1 RNA-directed DNA polymerase [Pseudomonas veronii]
MTRNVAARSFKVSDRSVADLPNLATALSIPLATLQKTLTLPKPDRYRRDELPKSDGGLRIIYNPSQMIRLVQRRINLRFFSNSYILAWPPYLFGSIPKSRDALGNDVTRDYITCAAQHCGAKSLLKLDVKDFFDNVHSDLVYGIFKDLLKFPHLVAASLTNICTFESHLIQGALTSSFLANLCLHDVEAFVVDRLAKKNLTYTRFVDDITVSSKIAKYDFSYAQSIIEEMLISKDLPLNSQKTKIFYSSSTPLTVHGLRINFSKPRLPSDEVGRIRAAVRNIEKIANERSYRMTHAYRHDYNRCMGRVNKLARLEHKQHRPLLQRLLKLPPLPSKKDISRAIQIISRLERDFYLKKATYWYSRRFYIAYERLNVLKVSYPRMTKHLKLRLKKLKPTYV